MPIGIISDCLSVFLGGLFGPAAGRFISEKTRGTVTVILGICALSIGINSVIKVNSMTPVVIAVILGTLCGDYLKLEARITALFGKILHGLVQDRKNFDMDNFITVVVLFCASGFGIYGVLTEGMSGNPEILLSKSVLDFFTAFMFAASLGISVALVAVFMLAVFAVLFMLSSFLGPVITPAMLQDFMACGGILTIAAGLRVSKIKNIPIADMIPALIFVLPFSAVWSFVMP
jgi:uncharacterized membrane protein YqgA involved in biofilm formation